MRVVFLGTPETALPALEALLGTGHTVPLVVTRPDRPAGRSRVPRPSPVKQRAAALGLPVTTPGGVRSGEFLAELLSARPDVLAIVAFGRMLPAPVLRAAPHGAINVHFSLLPRYRGAAPVSWALARGESTTGVTTFRLDEGLDTGDILMQRSVAIEPHEHAPALLRRLAGIGAGLLLDTLEGVAAGSIVPTRQDPAAASLAPLLKREDGLYDPGWTAAELAGRVRGFDPWPAVWARGAASRLRLVDVAIDTVEASAAPPGTVLPGPGETVRLACASGTVASVAAIQPDGARVMAPRAAINGRRLRLGERLERPQPEA
ncbi:MAG TPA: methionyl-tRNA formyltransferase [Candidatus Sulfotelmatobacter sp.]|nr:methionyl-tRNA formyltransferase [Candidatus Sulfotelmatobacter sp.]